jgi:uncharacterized protein (DUF2062 family)
MRRYLKRLPTRDELAAKPWARWMGPILRKDSIWGLNRRSVARGVALGLFFGTIIPFGQSIAAAFFVAPLRANIAVAAASTFITNPFTTPLFYLGAYQTGSWLLSGERGQFRMPAGETFWEQAVDAWEWLLSASTPTILGLFVIASVLALTGYVAVNIAWRLWWTARVRRRARRRARLARDAAASAAFTPPQGSSPAG